MFPLAPVGHPKDFLLEPKQDSVERGMAFFVGGEGEDRNDACYLSGKSCRIFIEKGVNLKDDLTFAEVDFLCTH